MCNLQAFKEDLVQDVLDVLYDEWFFDKLVHSVDASYQNEMDELKHKLYMLQRQRSDDMDHLQQKRSARLKSGITYPKSPKKASPSNSNNNTIVNIHYDQQQQQQPASTSKFSAQELERMIQQEQDQLEAEFLQQLPAPMQSK